MRKILLFIVILNLPVLKIRAQTWTQLPNLPFQTVLDTFLTARYGCGFVIGSNIYYLPPDTSRLWCYNTLTASWTRKSVFPPGIRSNASAFAIEPFGYVTCGRSYGTTSVQMLDLWQYNPALDVWTQKSNMATFPREYATAFVINGKAYVGGGNSTSAPAITPYISSMREYNPTTDTWSNMAAIPDVNNPPFKTNGRAYATAFAFGGYGYILNGLGNGSLLTDTRQYNPVTNTWVSLSAGFGNNIGGTGISDGNRGFLCFGQAGLTQSTYSFVWQLDSTLTWAPKSNFPGLSRKFAAAFTVGCQTYILGGLNYNASGSPANIPLIDFWKSECNTLPVNMLNFDVTYQADDFENVMVSWQTASEINSKSFTVEIFAEGKFYEKLVPAKGNSNQVSTYVVSFSLPSRFGSNQTRVSLSETDDEGKYTKILERYIDCEGSFKTDWVIFPNPSDNGAFEISGINLDPRLIKVRDGQGREISFDYYLHDQGLSLQLNNSSLNGMYYLLYQQSVYKLCLMR
jgi:N-acetylneuraminic acid mutarotase